MSPCISYLILFLLTKYPINDIVGLYPILLINDLYHLSSGRKQIQCYQSVYTLIKREILVLLVSSYTSVFSFYFLSLNVSVKG